MAPNPLLVRFTSLLKEGDLSGPILDLACGDGQNGLFLAGLGLPVVLADRNQEALNEAKRVAKEKDLSACFWTIDFETESNPLKEDHFRSILVFRYLHRPLIPCLKKGITKGGILIYETFTVDQTRYGSPHNPDFLLKPNELFNWFKDWSLIHYFEGILEDPRRAVAQIVSQKPF